MECLDVTTNRDRFGDDGSVVQFQYGELADRVKVKEFGGSVLAFGYIDFLQRYLDTFFGKEYSHAPRVHPRAEVV